MTTTNEPKSAVQVLREALIEARSELDIGCHARLIAKIGEALAATEQAERAAIQPAVAVPKSNDGKEQDAFEAWASGERYDMTTHPLHWLFLNERTNAARQGWKAALEYVNEAIAAPVSAPVPEAEAEQCEHGTPYKFHCDDCDGRPAWSDPTDYAPAVKHEASELPKIPRTYQQTAKERAAIYEYGQECVRAARQAPSIAAPVGSIGNDAEFWKLLQDWFLVYPNTKSLPLYKKLIAYIDARSPVAAPDTSAREDADKRDMAKWIVRERKEWNKDHACAQCVPGGEIVKAGFTCVYHKAVELLATAASSGEKGAGDD